MIRRFSLCAFLITAFGFTAGNSCAESLFESIPGARPRVESAAPQFRDRRVVRLHPEALNGSKFQIVLSAERTEEAIVRHSALNANGDRVVSGKLRGLPDSSFTLVLHRDAVAADIAVSIFEQYQIRGLAVGAEFRRLDERARLRCETGSGAERLPSPRSVTGSAAAAAQQFTADDPAQFDVMIVYTPAARDSAGGVSSIEAEATLAIESANTAYANSGIATRARLVRTQEIEYTESGTALVDLKSLTSTTDGIMDEVHDWRDQCHADVVSLFVDHIEPGLGGLANLAVTVGSDGKQLPRPELAFSVVVASIASPTTFPHEVGHNFGCQHDAQNASFGPSFFTYGYGWRFTGNDGMQYRTIMAYAPGQSVPYFSSPTVQYQGVATGVAGVADNVRLINENAPLLANFRSERLMTVTASAPVAYEKPAQNGRFTFLRGGPVDQAVTVNYTVGGTATNGVDCQALPGSVVIPAGAASADVNVVPSDDATPEGVETISVLLTPGNGYLVTDANFATVTIHDSPVTVGVATGAGGFVFSRTGATDQALPVTVHIRGTGVIGRDFLLGSLFLPTGNGYTGSVTIPAGAPSVTLPITPLLNLVAGTAVVCEVGGSDGYQPLDPAAAAMFLLNDGAKLPQLSVASIPSSTGLPAFRFTRTGAVSQPMEVDFNLAGAAQLTVDYQIASYGYYPVTTPGGLTDYSLMMPAGSSTLDLTTVEIPGQGDATAKDVRLSLEPSHAAGGYAVAASGSEASATTAAVSVAMAPAFTGAISATGYLETPFSLQLAATSSPTQYGAAGLPDGLALDPATGIISGTPTTTGTFTVALTASNSTGSGSGTLTITVGDVPTGPFINVAATVPQATEVPSKKALLTLTRTGDLSNDLTVLYQTKGSATPGVNYKALSGQAVIPAGSDNVKIKIKPIDDHQKTGNRKIKFSLLPDAAYQLGAASTAKISIIDGD